MSYLSVFAFSFFLLVSSLSNVACRPTGNNNNNNEQSTNNENTDNDGGQTNPEKSTGDKKQVKLTGIPAMRDPASSNRPAEDDVVQIKGVVVTSQMFTVSATTGLQGFFVSDPGFPAKYGGMMVVVEKEFSEKLEIGDVINIEGVYKEYFGNSQIDAQSTLGGLVSKTGTNKKADIKATLITPADIPGTPADISKPNESKAEPYEGMYVELKDVTVSKDADNYGVFELEGGVVVDDTFFKGFKPKKGDKIAFIRGVVQYAYDLYRVLPLNASDIDGATAECAADADCGTGRKCDTDAGSCKYIVCGADADCKTGEKCITETQRCEKPQQTLTIVDIQDPNSSKHPSKGDAIEVKGAIVISQMFDAASTLKGFFVSDPSFPAKYGAVMVVVDKDFAETLAIGDEVDIVGRADEYYFNTQIAARAAQNGKITKTGNNKLADIKPVTVTAADVPGAPKDKTDPETSATEPYEGMLVELKNIKVAKEADQYGVIELEGGVIVDDTLFKGYAPKVGDTIAFIRGVIQYSYDVYRILPRSDKDIDGAKPPCAKDEDCASGETCNTSTGVCVGPPKTYSVKDLQDPTSTNYAAKGTAVEIKGVIVTSELFDVSSTLKGFYVADPGFAGKYSGVMVVVDSTFSETLAIGDEVDIVGRSDEYFNNTQLVARATQSGKVTKTGNNKVADIKYTAVNAADLQSTPDDKTDPDKTKTEPYEGVLIELKNVTVEEEADQYGVWKLSGGIVVDDNLFKGYKPTKGDKLEYVRGVIFYSYDLYRLLPRSAADIKAATP
tara:strand:- start:5949 stop:8297 length:2349 start_codon:yes stop_codon:yes gene_type:complete